MRGPTIKRRFYCTSWHNLGDRGDWLWVRAAWPPEMLPKILMLTGELSMISAETVQMEDWKMNMNDELNGVQIKELRKGLGLTQEEFAHAVAVTFSTVNRWENGHAKPDHSSPDYPSGRCAISRRCFPAQEPHDQSDGRANGRSLPNPPDQHRPQLC